MAEVAVSIQTVHVETDVARASVIIHEDRRGLASQTAV